MKIWIIDTQTPTHRLVRVKCENQLGYEYLGDLNDNEIREFILSVKEDDVEKNMKLLHYYGYLHLFIIKK
ncbi:hypothetical protein [Sulfurimonas sp.]